LAGHGDVQVKAACVLRIYWRAAAIHLAPVAANVSADQQAEIEKRAGTVHGHREAVARRFGVGGESIELLKNQRMMNAGQCAGGARRRRRSGGS
jgi:hypothetical protein